MHSTVLRCALLHIVFHRSMLPRVYHPELKDNLYERRAASITAQLFGSKEFGIGQSRSQSYQQSARLNAPVTHSLSHSSNAALCRARGAPRQCLSNL